MPDQDIDQLFRQLRRTAPSAPSHLSDEIVARLGSSVVQKRVLLVTGTLCCLAAVFVSAGITLETLQRNHSSTPPALALFSAEPGPITSR